MTKSWGFAKSPGYVLNTFLKSGTTIINFKVYSTDFLMFDDF